MQTLDVMHMAEPGCVSICHHDGIHIAQKPAITD